MSSPNLVELLVAERQQELTMAVANSRRASGVRRSGKLRRSNSSNPEGRSGSVAFTTRSEGLSDPRSTEVLDRRVA